MLRKNLIPCNSHLLFKIITLKHFLCFTICVTVTVAIDDVILDLMDEDGELDKEGVKLQLIYDQIYNAN